MNHFLKELLRLRIALRPSLLPFGPTLRCISLFSFPLIGAAKVSVFSEPAKKIQLFFRPSLSLSPIPCGAAKVTSFPLTAKSFFRFFRPGNMPDGNGKTPLQQYLTTPFSQKTSRIPSFAECKDRNSIRFCKTYRGLFFRGICKGLDNSTIIFGKR